MEIGDVVIRSDAQSIKRVQPPRTRLLDASDWLMFQTTPPNLQTHGGINQITSIKLWMLESLRRSLFGSPASGIPGFDWNQQAT